MKLTDFLTQNGFSYKADPKNEGLIVLTGEWISDMSQDVFDDAAIVSQVEGNVYRVSDCSGEYRLELLDGSGPNGTIREWDSAKVA